jgi:hypothetical protein
MGFCPACGHQLNLGTELFCPNCGQNLAQNKGAPDQAKYSIAIEKTGGDVIGVGIDGSGNILGENVVVGSGSIKSNEAELQKIPDEYAQALKEFSKTIEQQLRGRDVKKEQVQAINDNLSELAKEVIDVKPGTEPKTDYTKQSQIELKTESLIQKVLDVIPQAAETVATFTPLAPFSKIIGKGVADMVNSVAKRKNKNPTKIG